MAFAHPTTAAMYAELEDEIAAGTSDGTFIQQAARKMLVMLGMPFVGRTVANEEANHGARMEAYKEIVRLANVEPKFQSNAGGPTFQLSINLPTGALPQPGAFKPDRAETPAAPTIVIDMTPIAAKTEADPLPPMPAYLKIPDFTTTRDLVGPQLPQAPR